MELKLEIKFASVEELATVAKALTGLKVEGTTPSKEVTNTAVTATPVVTAKEAAPAPAADTAKKAEPKLTAAEKKAAKKEQEEAEKADRIARLKASMESDKAIADAALAKSAAKSASTTTTVQDENPEDIAEEIKALGDTLMGFQGMPIEAKQQLTGQVMAKVGVPQGVRPSMLQQPMLGQFRDEYRAAVESVVNPVMGGLV